MNRQVIFDVAKKMKLMRRQTFNDWVVSHRVETKEDDKFVEGEVKFKTEEKAFVLKQLDREWGVNDAEAVLSVQSKLK